MNTDTLPLDLTGFQERPARSITATALELLPRAAAARATVDPGAEDLLRAISLVVGIGGLDHSVATLKIFGAPWSKSRPRTTRTGQMYQKPEDREAERALAATFVRWADRPMLGNVALAAIFYRPNRQRIDADNLLKHVCDSANGILWDDDSQVTAVCGIVELDAGLPRTVVAVAQHRSTLTRGIDWTNNCTGCGDAFVVDPKNSARRYCSNDCANAACGRVLGAAVPCASCGEPFKRRTATQKFCSVACRTDFVRGVPKGTAKFSCCTTCGKELTHKRGGQCRPCWARRGQPLATDQPT